jgi:hypothetical protein
MSDIFESQATGLTSPARNHFAITPHNSTDFTANNTRAIYVGGAGNIVIVTENGDAVTYSNVPAGTIIPIVAKRVNSTNTTATNLVGMY